MSLKHRLEAVRDLAGRYGSLFAHFWGRRKALDGGIFNEDEAEFLPSALSLQKTPVSPAVRVTAWTLSLLVFACLVWACVGQVDIVVNASGKIIPDARTKTIAAVDTASVKAIYVQEDQLVKRGQILLQLDTSAYDAERDKALGDERMELLQVARARALIQAVDTLKKPFLPKPAGIPDDKWQAEQAHLDGQYLEFMASLKRVESDIRRYRQELRQAAKVARDYRLLAGSHDVSQVDYAEKEQARVEARRQLDDAQKQKAELLAQTRREAYDSLSEGLKAAAESLQDAQGASDHAALLTLTAPVDGTVQQLAVHTVGGVVEAAKPLMLIVPQGGPLEVEAYLADRDVGFVSEGQDAAVKVDAFEYTKYGTVPAKVLHVSRDAIQDEKKGLQYSVIVQLGRSALFVDGREAALGVGMSVKVEIKTGRRRVIEYVLSPLSRHAHESLNER